MQTKLEYYSFIKKRMYIKEKAAWLLEGRKWDEGYYDELSFTTSGIEEEVIYYSFDGIKEKVWNRCYFDEFEETVEEVYDIESFALENIRSEKSETCPDMSVREAAIDELQFVKGIKGSILNGDDSYEICYEVIDEKYHTELFSFVMYLLKNEDYRIDLRIKTDTEKRNFVIESLEVRFKLWCFQFGFEEGSLEFSKAVRCKNYYEIQNSEIEDNCILEQWISCRDNSETP